MDLPHCYSPFGYDEEESGRGGAAAHRYEAFDDADDAADARPAATALASEPEAAGYAASYGGLGADDTAPGAGGAGSSAALDSDDDGDDDDDDAELAAALALSRDLARPTAGDSTWNSRFQAVLERPAETAIAAQSRQEELSEIVASFVRRTGPIARTIVRESALEVDERTIKPESAMGGVAGGAKYVVDDVVYKFAVDDHGLYGGAAHALKAAACEVRAINAALQKSVSHLHFALSALFIVRGHGVIATARLPVTKDTLRVGTADGGRTLRNGSVRVRRLLGALGKSMGLAPHRVAPAQALADAVAVTVDTAADVEGHEALDGRIYALDLGRLLPVVPPDARLRGSHLWRQFRPEFLARWGPPLSSDAFTGFGRLDHEVHNAASLKAAKHLKLELPKEIARRIDEGGESSGSVAHACHEAGCNLRYLVRVWSCCSKPSSRAAVAVEALARAVKGEVLDAMRSITDADDGPYERAAAKVLSDLAQLLLHADAENSLRDPVVRRLVLYFGAESEAEAKAVIRNAAAPRAPDAARSPYDVVRRAAKLSGVSGVADSDEAAAAALAGAAVSLQDIAKAPVPPPLPELHDAARRLREELAMREAVLKDENSAQLLPTLEALLRVYMVHRDESAGQATEAAAAVRLYASRIRSITERVHGTHSIEYAEAIRLSASVETHWGDHARAADLAEAAVQMIGRLKAEAEARIRDSSGGGGSDEPAESTPSPTEEESNGRSPSSSDGSNDRGEVEALDAVLLAALSTSVQALQEGGRYSDALGGVMKALALAEKLHGSESHYVAAMLNAVASVQVYLGGTQQAIDAARRSVNILTKLFGEDHVTLADPLHTLAVVYKRAHKPDEAIRLLARAVSIKEADVGPEHPDLLAYLNNLAGCYFVNGDLDMALEMYERVDSLFGKSLGSDHPDRAGVLQNMGTVQMSRGTAEGFDIAAAKFTEAAAIMERAFGHDHPKLSIVRLNIAQLELRRSNPAECLRIAVAEIEALQRSVGDGSQHVAEAHGLCGHAYRMMGRMDDAATSFEAAAEVRVGVFGAADPVAAAWRREAAGVRATTAAAPDLTARLAQLHEMGLTDDARNRAALARTGGNVEAAIGLLLG